MNRLQTNKGYVNRDKKITFSFNGKQYEGFEGDTIASALLANEVKLIGRSFKYRRPRGIVTCDVSEPNALVQVEKGAHTIPNVISTQAEIYEGMVVNSLNCFNLKYDPRSVIGLFSRLLPAGFYYKTFMWPKNFWKKYEYFIRKSAGFGKPPKVEDPSHYDSIFVHCDILIVGAGPAGIFAALEAVESGARIILVDENHYIGGSLITTNAIIDGKKSDIWLQAALEKLASYHNITIYKRSTAFGYYDHNLVYVLQRLENHLPIRERQSIRERILKIRAKRVLLATGAIEKPMLFENNDRAGVMTSGAILKYLSLYNISPGKDYVIYTNNDSAYKTALKLIDEKQNVAAIIDARESIDPAIEDLLKNNSIKLYKGYGITKAVGQHEVQSVFIQKLNDDRTTFSGEEVEIYCDVVACSGGWSPAIHLSSQSGAKAIWDDGLYSFIPGIPVQEEASIGSCNGTYDFVQTIQEAIESSAQAVREVIHVNHEVATHVPHIEVFEPYTQDEFFLATNHSSLRRSGKQFVDLQNDVTIGDIELAAAEGYESIEHVKRYTALGFGTDQGKLGNIIGMNVLAKVLGKKPHEVGTTTFRPAYTPVTFGALAGQHKHHLFEPVRKTPIHYWHEENGATFEDVGQWKRAWYYPQNKETMHETLNRETLATHDSIGLMDASTLGKIDIQGPDAAKFLNLIYTNPWLKLEIGKCRYGIMLSEDGMVMDDGVTMRLAENHFVMTTTTGGAARILTWLEHWLQTEWPELKVYLTSVTDHYSSMAVSGPNSRKLLQKICPTIDFDSEFFPFMGVKEGDAAGVPARILRISFTGELSYEIHVDANYARYIWEQLIELGKEFNITPYGTETMHILRAEKGFIIVGQDTDGTVTPHDLDMSWAIGKKKIDFLGKHSLDRPAMLKEDRKQLVGLLTKNPEDIIPEGAQIVNDTKGIIPTPMQGHVTSSYYSAINKHSIAMALIKNGFNRYNQTVYVALADGSFIEATITKPVFYDPKGERQNV